MTPAEKAGWKVGDRGVVRYVGQRRDDDPFTDESVVEFYEDDGSNSPRFRLIDGHCFYGGETAYEYLSNVIRSGQSSDLVNHPPHYTQGGVECIDAIRAALTGDEFRGYCKGAAQKYLWRERHKGGDESLRKARWYINELLGENER